MFDCLISHGMEPNVTLHHFTQVRGGYMITLLVVLCRGLGGGGVWGFRLRNWLMRSPSWIPASVTSLLVGGMGCIVFVYVPPYNCVFDPSDLAALLLLAHLH